MLLLVPNVMAYGTCRLLVLLIKEQQPKNQSQTRAIAKSKGKVIKRVRNSALTSPGTDQASLCP